MRPPENFHTDSKTRYYYAPMRVNASVETQQNFYSNYREIIKFYKSDAGSNLDTQGRRQRALQVIA